MVTFNANISGLRYLTPDTLFFSLTAPKEFTFQAGQFVTLMIKKEEGTKPRSYSIFNSPSEKGKVDLCIKIVEKGFASDIFAKSKENDSFEVRGPFGHFLFDSESEDSEHWFVCTGTGITPMISMIKEFVAKYHQKKFRVFWGLRHSKDIFFKQELDQLKKKHTNFDYLISLSQDEYLHTGRIQKHLGNNFKDKTFYICGLKEFVLETKDLLEKSGVPKEKVHFERYS